MDKERSSIFIPYENLPEAKNWSMGKNYRVKMVLEQTGSSKTGATFEISDATSMEPNDRTAQALLNSDSGMYMGK